mgnify:CR=1 FL=1
MRASPSFVYMTYQDLFLKKLAEKWFEFLDNDPDHGKTSFGTEEFKAAREAYEEFKKLELPDCICPAHTEEKKGLVLCTYCAHGVCLVHKKEEKREEPERWSPEILEDFWWINWDGRVMKSVWRGQGMLSEYEELNRFRTEKEALEKLEAVRAILKS